ncbi:hypothetical protein [Nonlabens xylanidelens]|nr:hypothetical protein [Nonlabens xylanidelens]
MEQQQCYRLGVATALTDAAGDPIGILTVNADGSFEFRSSTKL